MTGIEHRYTSSMTSQNVVVFEFDDYPYLLSADGTPGETLPPLQFDIDCAAANC